MNTLAKTQTNSIVNDIKQTMAYSKIMNECDGFLNSVHGVEYVGYMTMHLCKRIVNKELLVAFYNEAIKKPTINKQQYDIKMVILETIEKHLQKV